MQHTMALIGFGGMANWHCDSVRDRVPDLLVKGAYDVREEARNRAVEKGLVAYQSLEELLADKEVELVVVATPNNFHKELSIRSLRAGKHVVCEKPVTMNAEELEKVIAVSGETGRIFTVHQNRRWDRDYRIVRRVLEEGTIGKPYFIESRVQGSRGSMHGWRGHKVNGGGMTYDWGVHLIDQLLTMNKTPVKSIYCDMYHVHYAECDDGFKMIMKFADGVMATVEVGTSHFIEAPRWYVCGDRGALIIPDWSCNGKIVRAAQHEVTWEEEIIYTKAGPTKTMAPRAKDTIEETVIDGEPYVSDYDIFYRNLAEVLDGTAELRVKPAEAMRGMKVMEAAFASDRTGQTVLCEI